MEMIGKVRRLHHRDSKSVREISRITSLARNTVRKCLREPLQGEPKYRRSLRPGKLSAFHEALKQALSADAHRPKRERRTALALYGEMKAAGYAGGYTRVTDFIRAWRDDKGHGAGTNAFVPLAFELGEAFQFDWSEEGLVVGGIYYRMQVAHLKLCASRAFWLVAYSGQGHEMLFDAHTRSFAALGGIARRGIYDLHVDRRGQGKEGQGPSRQRPLCCAVRALPVRRRVLQRRQRLGERRRGEERAGQPAAHLARRGQTALRFVRRTQRLVGWPLPCAVGRDSPPRAPAVQRGRGARARTSAPDAHARAVRRLRREAGACVQHLPGVGGAQPLLGAVRTRRADGEHSAVSGPRGGSRGRRCGGPPRAAEQRSADALRLAALRAAAATQAGSLAQRRAVRRHAPAAAAAAPGAAARERGRSGDGARCWPSYPALGWRPCWWRWSWRWTARRRRVG
jgi:hypothetical protein